MQNSINFVEYSGEESVNFIDDLSSLRIQVFREYPYLYDGTVAYEKNYLQTYLSSSNCFLTLCRDGELIIGAATAIPMSDEENSFKEPIERAGLNPNEICYFGESVLLKEYRGRGIGKTFLRIREDFAKSIGLNTVMFCSVVRAANHPICPPSYRSLEPFWRKEGYEKVPGLFTEYSWKDLNEIKESKKSMQFWKKNLEP